MTLKIYGLTQCSTCVKARTWFEQKAIAYVFVDYRAQPISEKELVRWAQSLGGFEKLVNRASMTWRQLDSLAKDPQTPAQWLALIAQYPALIRRPLVHYPDDSVTVGFNEKSLAEKLGVA